MSTAAVKAATANTGSVESAPMESTPVVSAMTEGMAVEMVSAVISASDEDIVVGTVITIIRSHVWPWVPGVIIGPIVPRVTTVKIGGASATGH